MPRLIDCKPFGSVAEFVELASFEATVQRRGKAPGCYDWYLITNTEAKRAMVFIFQMAACCNLSEGYTLTNTFKFTIVIECQLSGFSSDSLQLAIKARNKPVILCDASTLVAQCEPSSSIESTFIRYSIDSKE